MLDFIGTVVISAVMVVNINAVISTMSVAPASRLGLATVSGLWI